MDKGVCIMLVCGRGVVNMGVVGTVVGIRVCGTNEGMGCVVVWVCNKMMVLKPGGTKGDIVIPSVVFSGMAATNGRG